MFSSGHKHHNPYYGLRRLGPVYQPVIFYLFPFYFYIKMQKAADSIENCIVYLMTFMDSVYLCSLFSSLVLFLIFLSFFGMISFIVAGVLIVVVKMKNVISKKPRSTICVMSTRVDSFLAFLSPGPFLWPLSPAETSIEAIYQNFNDYFDFF